MRQVDWPGLFVHVLCVYRHVVIRSAQVLGLAHDRDHVAGGQNDVGEVGMNKQSKIGQNLLVGLQKNR